MRVQSARFFYNVGPNSSNERSQTTHGVRLLCSAAQRNLTPRVVLLHSYIEIAGCTLCSLSLGRQKKGVGHHLCSTAVLKTFIKGQGLSTHTPVVGCAQYSQRGGTGNRRTLTCLCVVSCVCCSGGRDARFRSRIANQKTSGDGGPKTPPLCRPPYMIPRAPARRLGGSAAGQYTP